MALIPMDPDPNPSSWLGDAVYIVLILLAVVIGASGGLLDMWGQL